MMDYVIETHDLSKQFGAFHAVSGLNLRVARNQVTGFLGRNGAGKSTTIKMLLGMTQPTSGSGLLLGYSITDPKQDLEARRQVAYCGEDKQLYAYMTVKQLIRFTASFYPDWRSEVAARLLEQFQLPPGRKVKALSKGMRTKLALLLALARRPSLLILDEPTEGLDPVSIEELLQTLSGLPADGTTVFFSSHQISEVERIADRVCIIDGGRLAVDLSLDEIRQDHRRITFSFSQQPPEHLFDMPEVRSIETNGRQVIVISSQGSDAVVERAKSADAVVVDVVPVNLRELFLGTVQDHK
ncbi:ATP-binding cassette domain-containing protein [Acidobacteria bacterium AB60]|nr:ATP-binding cassette domain-containing protein [Acidobacteria bacterium AB60]